MYRIMHNNPGENSEPNCSLVRIQKDQHGRIVGYAPASFDGIEPAEILKQLHMAVLNSTHSPVITRADVVGLPECEIPF